MQFAFFTIYFVEKFDFMADLKTIVDAQNKTATIRMYGSIGYEVSGSDMAHAIASMSESEDVDVIQLRINSGGGSVIDGMSIVSAIRSSKAAVHCYVDGIAASMAAVIAVAGDRLLMMDYAKLMIHDPFYEGKKDLSPKEKKALDSITDMLCAFVSGLYVTGQFHRWMKSGKEGFFVRLCNRVCQANGIGENGKEEEGSNV